MNPNFCAKGKKWPKRELDGLTAMEDSDRRSRILPVWHQIAREEVTRFSATLAGLRALIADGKTPLEMVAELKKAIK
jgi:hypothetical protein